MAHSYRNHVLRLQDVAIKKQRKARTPGASSIKKKRTVKPAVEGETVDGTSDSPVKKRASRKKTSVETEITGETACELGKSGKSEMGDVPTPVSTTLHDLKDSTMTEAVNTSSSGGSLEPNTTDIVGEISISCKPIWDNQKKQRVNDDNNDVLSPSGISEDMPSSDSVLHQRSPKGSLAIRKEQEVLHVGDILEDQQQQQWTTSLPAANILANDMKINVDQDSSIVEGGSLDMNISNSSQDGINIGTQRKVNTLVTGSNVGRITELNIDMTVEAATSIPSLYKDLDTEQQLLQLRPQEGFGTNQ